MCLCHRVKTVNINTRDKWIAIEKPENEWLNNATFILILYVSSTRTPGALVAIPTTLYMKAFLPFQQDQRHSLNTSPRHMVPKKETTWHHLRTTWTTHGDHLVKLGDLLGKGGHTKTDEFLEEFQTTSDPPFIVHFQKMMLQIVQISCSKSPV